MVDVSRLCSQALSNSLAQMELRMSGRHSTKIAKTASIKTDNRFHRRTRSALPTNRAVDEAAAATAAAARGRFLTLGGERRENVRIVSSPPMWKLSPPPEAGSFDGPSPYNGGAGGRGKREFEGYFPTDSTNAAVPGAPVSFTPGSPVPDSGADDDSDGADDDDDMIFAFDDL